MMFENEVVRVQISQRWLAEYMVCLALCTTIASLGGNLFAHATREFRTFSYPSASQLQVALKAEKTTRVAANASSGFLPTQGTPLGVFRWLRGIRESFSEHRTMRAENIREKMTGECLLTACAK